MNLRLHGGEERLTDLSGARLGGSTGAATLRGSQLLYDGGRVRGQVEQAAAKLESQSHHLEETQQNVALELVSAYVDVLKFRSLKRLAETNVSVHREYLSKINRKFKSGAGPESDVTLVRGRMALAEAVGETRERQLQTANARFLKLTGVYPADLSEPEFPEWALPASFDEIDLSNNHEVRLAQSELKAALSRRIIAESARHPRLDLILEGDLNDTDQFGVRQENATALLSLSFDVFDGGRRRADSQRSKAEISEADWALKQAVINAETEYAIRLSELAAIENRIELLESHRDAMTSVVQAFHDQFELSKRPLINLLDVENELFAARSSVHEERYKRIQAAYRLLSATGDLLSAIK